MSANSADWENVVTTVNTDSADWQSGAATMSANSADWENNSTRVLAESGDWENTWTRVNANSATWEIGGTCNTHVNTYSGTWMYPHSARRLAYLVTGTNSFSVGDVLRKGTAANYHKAMANAAASADVVGVVAYASSSDFIFVHSGEVTLTSHGYDIGSTVFLSDGTAGSLSAVEPSNNETVSKPIGTVIDANTVLVQPTRGMVNVESTTPAQAAGWNDTGSLIQLIESTDKVSIGTTAEIEKLTVSGNISAHNVYFNSLTAKSDVVVTTSTLSAAGGIIGSGILDHGHTLTVIPSFSSENLQVAVISGAADVSASTGRTPGGNITLRLSAYNVNCPLTWNSSWIFMGSKPTVLPANKYGVLSLQCFGTAEADVIASFAFSN